MYVNVYIYIWIYIWIYLSPLSSEKATTLKGLRTFSCKPGPESGLDCLTCAMFARRRVRTKQHHTRPRNLPG